jgi:uncharacterized protein (UPF0264 family)
VELALSLVAIVLSVASYVGYRLLNTKLDLDQSNDHLERQGRILDRMELATFVVAADLADTHRRADAADSGIPGEAADAGAKSA